ncbi:Alpha/Beta hydrolase protein [Podospora fimiseda]|uniref:Alpha/Beta hydrolase protein n=1 Tax=Podospora fimiseda TaxID=252190 RepID=A0AAN7BXW4_9PEZI|nr:Alpha/Beta hydrolase protein [Podospora fimiseda]
MKPLTLFWASVLTLFPQTAHSTSCTTTTTPLPQTGIILTGPFPSNLHGSNFTYSHPIKLYRFVSQNSPQEMAFIDLPPSSPSPPATKKVALLLHGKNFCSTTFTPTALLLSTVGYRVILPDQLGFCKSSKPGLAYQFSLSQLSLNTFNLLSALNLTSSPLTIIGHSLGGMLATRFSLQYPSLPKHLIMINPIGLENYLSLGVPYPSIDSTYLTERSSNYSSIRAYQQSVYYQGQWSSKYDEPVNMLANIYQGSQAEEFAWCQAKIVDMVLTQPVSHEFGQIKVPKTLLLIGTKDTTAIGKQGAPKDVQERLGRYDLLGKEIAGVIPNSTLIEFEGMGHVPQMQDEKRFHEALVGWLREN